MPPKVTIEGIAIEFVVVLLLFVLLPLLGTQHLLSLPPGHRPLRTVPEQEEGFLQVPPFAVHEELLLPVLLDDPPPTQHLLSLPPGHRPLRTVPEQEEGFLQVPPLAAQEELLPVVLPPFPPETQQRILFPPGHRPCCSVPLHECVFVSIQVPGHPAAFDWIVVSSFGNWLTSDMVRRNEKTKTSPVITTPTFIILPTSCLCIFTRFILPCTVCLVAVVFFFFIIFSIEYIL